MNAGAPTCTTCGGLNTNPQAGQCRFCGQQLAAAPPPQGHGAPQGYGGPPAGGYGTPPPNAYGAPPPHGYGAPQGYGGPPNPYGGQPQNPYGYPVQGFGGVQPFQQGYPQPNRGGGWARGLSGGLSTFFWVRLVIAGIAISLSLLGACVSALTH